MTENNNIPSQILLIVSVVIIHVSLFVWPEKWTIAGFSLLLITVLFTKKISLFHYAIMAFLISINMVWFPDWMKNLPVLPFLIPFLFSTVILVPIFSRKEIMPWARKGYIDQVSRLLIIATGLVSTIALIVWAIWTDNLGIGVQMMEGFSAYPKWFVLGLAIPIFAILNSFAEEAVYRGVLQEALERTFRQHWITWILQASAFAAAHYLYGFPNGYAGYIMVFIYGFMLGYIRTRTKGIVAPWLTHLVSDLTIGYFMYSKI